MRALPESVILHSSVPSRWWLLYTPQSVDARRFLDEALAARRLVVAAVEGIDLQVLAALAVDLQGIALDPSIGSGFYLDVTSQFQALLEGGVMRLVGRAELARSAFIIATSFGVVLEEALSVALAHAARLPLLIADEALERTLRPLEAELPGFRVISLREYTHGV